MTEYQKYSMTTSSGGVTKYYASSKAPWNPNASRIQKITVTDGVTTIGTGAFYVCLHVKDISIPASVTGIGDAFSSCSELADVYYGGTNGQWCQISFNGNNNELFAAEVHYASLTELSGSCGEGLTWLLDDTGKLTISAAHGKT